MIFKISEDGKRILQKAMMKAKDRKQEFTTLHLLLVFCEEPGLASSILSHCGVTKDWIRSCMKADKNDPPGVFDKLNLEAQHLAETIRSPKIQDLHLLAGLVRIEESLACRWLSVGGFNPSHIYSYVVGYLTGTGKRSSFIGQTSTNLNLLPDEANRDASRAAGKPGQEPQQQEKAQVSLPLKASQPRPARSALQRRIPDKPAERKPAAPPQEQIVVCSLRWKIDEKHFPVTSQLGANLNLKAVSGEIDELLGRHREIDCLMDVLGRRKANNPILVGESGVGKTAIVEGLALKIVRGEVDESFREKIIIAVASSSFIGGTSIRGSLCEKFTALRKESGKLPGKLVLFFDDAVEILKSIESGGEGVLAEIKDALAQGSLPSIFTATPSSWKKITELDVGFSRCLTPIYVEEVGQEEALGILNQLAPRYAAWHNVEIDAEAGAAAVNLSTRYLAGRKNPEKSLMVLDLAAARTSRSDRKVVSTDVVAQVVSSLADVPVERLAETDGDRLMSLEDRLSERIVGHVEAIRKIASTMKRNAAGFRAQRPIGSFLFLGPTGVGKTEMAKAMARLLFGKDSSMIRFDMSEFAEAHSVSRLIGAPPGYVGFEKGGELTDAIIDHPYRLILMDEFEKAHSAVHRLLLQLLEEGRLTDSHGRTAAFSNCIVVLTSNIGSDLKVKNPAGFAAGRETAITDYRGKMLGRAMEVFSPELMNRIDDTIIFSPLTEDEVKEIARRLLRLSGATIQENRGIKIQWNERVVDYLIASGGFDPQLGARPMRRTIQSHVESLVADSILTGRLRRGGSVHLAVEEGGKLQCRIRNRNQQGGGGKRQQKVQRSASVGRAIGFK
jgi:ATP-dependent Clp protease ATP-binding subunit ClpC